MTPPDDPRKCTGRIRDLYGPHCSTRCKGTAVCTLIALQPLLQKLEAAERREGGPK